MPQFFAQFILSAAVTLQPGVDLQWPVLATKHLGPGVTATVAASQAGQAQGICVDKAGAYTVALRLGMVPMEAGSASGWVMLDTAHEEVLLVTWRAAGEWTLTQGSAVVWMPQAGCMMLRYAASAAATVNHDPRVTTLTISRTN